MKHTGAWTFGGGLVAALLCATPATAQTIASPFASLSGLTPVSDHDLSHLRGRYVSFGQVQYFGVRMETTWHTQSGATLDSSVNLDLDTHGHQPQVHVRSSATITGTPGGPSQPQGSVDNTQGTSTGSGQGVTQVIQIAANGNQAGNNLTLDVTNQAPPSGGGSPSGNGPTDSHAGAQGVTVQAGINKGGLETNIVAVGQGAVHQTINGNALTSGVVQNIVVTSPNNQIQNSLTLTLGVAPGSGVTGGPVTPLSSTLGTLMGIPRVGG